MIKTHYWIKNKYYEFDDFTVEEWHKIIDFMRAKTRKWLSYNPSKRDIGFRDLYSINCITEKDYKEIVKNKIINPIDESKLKCEDRETPMNYFVSFFKKNRKKNK